jgi:hypothetical protein
MDWPHLRDEITATTARVGDELRALPDGDVRLSRVTWSAAELGAPAAVAGRAVRQAVRRNLT